MCPQSNWEEDSRFGSTIIWYNDEFNTAVPGESGAEGSCAFPARHDDNSYRNSFEDRVAATTGAVALDHGEVHAQNLIVSIWAIQRTPGTSHQSYSKPSPNQRQFSWAKLGNPCTFRDRDKTTLGIQQLCSQNAPTQADSNQRQTEKAAAVWEWWVFEGQDEPTAPHSPTTLTDITQRLTTPAELTRWVQMNDAIRSDPAVLDADIRTATGEDRNNLLRAKRERAVIDIAYFRARSNAPEEAAARTRYAAVPEAIRSEDGASTPIAPLAPPEPTPPPPPAMPAPPPTAMPDPNPPQQPDPPAPPTSEPDPPQTQQPQPQNTQTAGTDSGGSSSGVAIAAAGAGAVGIGYLVWLFWPDTEVVPYAIGSNDGYGYRFGVERRFGNHRLGIHHEPENDAAGIRWEFRW